MFEGSSVALVTPMMANGDIDEKCFIDLIEWHIAEGTQAIVISGTTGESATLAIQERRRLISLGIEVANKRVLILAGTGSNSTQTTIERTKIAQKLGADACLVVSPYYNRPTQGGLIKHYTAVAAAVDIPILLYNVPSRTGCDMVPETVATLSDIPNIVGIKEATGNLQRLQVLREKCKAGFTFYSGDDPTALEFIRQGGQGVISITANVAPKMMQEMCHFALIKEDEKAKAIDDKLHQLHRLLIIEPNPIPVKWAMHYLGRIPEGIRLPLTTLSKEYHAKMKEALQVAGIR